MAAHGAGAAEVAVSVAHRAAELRRRKVFRAAAVYGAAAFVVVQAADIVFPRLALPDWTVTLVVALALLGLVPALALAWHFDATPDGMRRTARATPDELVALAAQPRTRRWAQGAAAFGGLLLLAGGAWWTLIGAGARSPAYDSIAVLPFVNLSGDPANDYFGDGLAEELLNALSSIDGLKVAARTSAFAFRGGTADVRTIGDTLRVATVLEGSVRRSADRIRISAQLVDARSGYRLWSQTYDRPLTELFSVQDAIASEIVNALALRLTGAARAEGLYRGGTSEVEAYDLYLLGRQKWATREIPLLHEAVEHFEQAIARDSSFALAWSGLADAIDALAWRRDAAALARIPEAKYAALQAILLDPQLAEGWASLGVLAMEFDLDWRVAELALRRAVELKPSYAMAHNWLADALVFTGRAEESLVHRFRAREHDPISPVQAGARVWALAAAGRWDEASAEFRALEPGLITTTETLLIAAAHARELGFGVAEAIAFTSEWARRIGRAQPEAEASLLARAIVEPALRHDALALLQRLEAEAAPAWDLAVLSVGLGDHENALRLLERALAEGDPQVVLTTAQPTFKPLRADPRFVAILRALRVPNAVMSGSAAAPPSATTSTPRAARPALVQPR
jgi:adenylate cyclase